MVKETSKEDVKSICVRVTKAASKKVAKVEADLNWLWTIGYGLFWLYINTQEQISLFGTIINVLTGFIISSTIYPLSTKSMKPNGNISKDSDKVFCFAWRKSTIS